MFGDPCSPEGFRAKGSQSYLAGVVRQASSESASRCSSIGCVCVSLGQKSVDHQGEIIQYITLNADVRLGCLTSETYSREMVRVQVEYVGGLAPGSQPGYANPCNEVIYKINSSYFTDIHDANTEWGLAAKSKKPSVKLHDQRPMPGPAFPAPPTPPELPLPNKPSLPRASNSA